MHRVFISQVLDSDTIVLSDPDQLHHLKDVLRLGVGDQITVCDALGEECQCVISRLGLKEAELAVKVRQPLRPTRVNLTVACAVPKRNKMDDVVDKLTQLGVDRIIPLRTARGVVRLDQAGEHARLERWRRLARSAAQQSRRSTVPVVDGVVGVGDLMARSADFDLKLFLTLSGARVPLPKAIAGKVASSIIVLIGPEGDFTSEEGEQARRAGFVAVSLGENVLRVETAAVAAVSHIFLSLVR